MKFSAYDARYLEPTKRFGARLASFDRRVHAAGEDLELAWS
jgi:predicted nucleic acid-binding protein